MSLESLLERCGLVPTKELRLFYIGNNPVKFRRYASKGRWTALTNCQSAAIKARYAELRDLSQIPPSIWSQVLRGQYFVQVTITESYEK